ncbi:2'-5' RNA ligase family protein [Propylenella binzhouense]|uniref:2'-5' RNA ligase family protein n=1 Tax=Propylenella binzhouense TaxID=2555902 RepID=A0A964T5K4_9HYPH|nr:2'-5' RNA ligase family protein [Propylenella binzhouense]MYZ48565.1 2'-5' RNA ligase family protein [Propylenella binzhouense]
MVFRPGVSASEPFVLTLELDGDSFARIDALRRRHYPAERNQVPAHVTLFHQLPAGRAREVKAVVRQEAQAQRPFDLRVASVKSIGTGVALFLESPQLAALRESLAREFRSDLSDQDRSGFRPHVTIQNKVPPKEADRLQRELAAGFRPLAVKALGLHLWRYRGGAWESVQVFRFGR